MKRFILTWFVLLLAGCSFINPAENQVVIQEVPDVDGQVFVEQLELEKNKVNDFKTLQTADGQFVIDNDNGTLQVVFKNEVVKEYKYGEILDFKVRNDRFVTYKHKFFSKVEYVVFDLERGEFYDVNGYGDFGDFLYDKNVAKLILCDDYKLDGFGHFTMVDLRFGRVQSFYNKSTDIGYVYSCDGVMGDPLKYEFNLIGKNELRGVLEFDKQMTDPNMYPFFLDDFGVYGDLSRLNLVKKRSDMDDQIQILMMNRKIDLGYELDLREFLPNDKLTPVELVSRFANYIDQHFKSAYQLIDNPGFSQAEFANEFESYNRYIGSFVTELDDGKTFELILKVPYKDQKVNFVRFVFEYNQARLKLIEKTNVLDAVLGSYADGRVQHVVRDGNEEILFDEKFVTSGCSDDKQRTHCGYIGFTGFEFLNDNVIYFTKTFYEGGDSYLLNLETGQVQNGLYFFSNTNSYVQNNYLWHCIGNGMLEGSVSLYDLDKMEFVKRVVSRDKAIIAECGKFNIEQNGFEYKIDDGSLFETPGIKDYDKYLESLPFEYLTVD